MQIKAIVPHLKYPQAQKSLQAKQAKSNQIEYLQEYKNIDGSKHVSSKHRQKVMEWFFPHNINSKFKITQANFHSSSYFTKLPCVGKCFYPYPLDVQRHPDHFDLIKKIIQKQPMPYRSWAPLNLVPFHKCSIPTNFKSLHLT